MPSFAVLFKSEIERISKKVIRQQVGPMQSTVSTQRRQISALKKQVAALEKEVSRLKRGTTSAARSTAAPPESASNLRFVAKGFKSLRNRLGLTAEGIALLLEVSPQSVYNWEHGKAKPRAAQVQAIATLRGLGKKEAQARLDALSSNRK